MSDFRSAAEAALREGFTFFDQLGSRSIDGGFELWLRVLDPTTFAARVIKGQISTADTLVDHSGAHFPAADFSVVDLWAGAKWAEAEIAVDFRRAASRLTSSGESAHPGGP
jgi:hypothetical protein